MRPGEHWSDEENSIVVDAYMRLLESELRNEKLVKARVNQEVAQRTGRGRGSVEYKFQNISAVLGQLRHPFVSGYKPAVKYQDSLRREVIRQLNARPELVDIAFRAMTKPGGDFQTDLRWRTIPPPDVEVRHSGSGVRVGKWDFVRLDAENRSLGRAGELAVVAREKALLRACGRHDLAQQVEHVSMTRGDGLGYDVLSFESHGEKKFIEVKTTRLGSHWPMVVSRNEISFSRRESERFHLYRVFDFTPTAAGLYTLKGDVTETCELTATAFQALPKDRDQAVTY